MSSPAVRVLIVDDSAFMRRMLKETLQREADIEVVGVAADGEEALAKVAALRPDIVTLDLMMPRLDGIEFLREQGRRGILPVIVVSILEEEHDLALTALELGAIDIVHKPGSGINVTVFEMATELVQKIRLTAAAKLPDAAPAEANQNAAADVNAAADMNAEAPGSWLTPPYKVVERGPAAMPVEAVVPEIVLIGTSTGGPHALRQILPFLSAGYPLPVVVAIHMPSGYTRSFAERLNTECPLEVAEAAEGDLVLPGRILIAPAGVHTRFDRTADGVRIRLSAQPFELPHRPSVDILFSSAALAYGATACAFVLTGMGEDGAIGAKQLFDLGGKVFAESQESCIVYGMPRAVVEAGIVERVLPLSRVAGQIRLLGSLTQS
ncbi:MAG: chemotaxis-specific protein-glutamate methyltransferase CheB [Bacteroidota bacterium]